MEHQAYRCSGQHGSMTATGSGSTCKHGHSGQGMCDRALAWVRQQSEVDGYVIQIDGHRGNEGRDKEATRHVDEARQGQ
jgi:hypothetical protein